MTEVYLPPEAYVRAMERAKVDVRYNERLRLLREELDAAVESHLDDERANALARLARQRDEALEKALEDRTDG